MNTPHKHAEVIKKWADGAKIQYKPTGTFEWDDIDKPSWFENVQYRVKPNKVKGWINIYPSNGGWVPGSGVYASKEEAKRTSADTRGQQIEIEYEKE